MWRKHDATFPCNGSRLTHYEEINRQMSHMAKGLAVTTLCLIGCWLSLPCVWLAAGCHYLASDWLLAVTTLCLIGCWLSLPWVWLAAGCHYLLSDWLLAVTTLCLIGCWLSLPCVWLAAGCHYLVSDWLLVGTFSGLICQFLVYQLTKSWTRLFVDTKSVRSPGIVEMPPYYLWIYLPIYIYIYIYIYVFIMKYTREEVYLWGRKT